MRLVGTTLLVALVLIATGCGKTEDKRSSQPSAPTSTAAPDLESICQTMADGDPKAELPTPRALMKSAAVARILAGQFDDGGDDAKAFNDLAAAYEQQAQAGRGLELLDARAAVRDAVAEVATTCNGIAGYSTG